MTHDRRQGAPSPLNLDAIRKQGAQLRTQYEGAMAVLEKYRDLNWPLAGDGDHAPDDSVYYDFRHSCGNLVQQVEAFARGMERRPAQMENMRRDLAQGINAKARRLRPLENVIDRMPMHGDEKDYLHSVLGSIEMTVAGLAEMLDPPRQHGGRQ